MFSEKQLLTLIELLAHKVKNPTHAMGLNLEVLRSKLTRSKLPDVAEYQRPLDLVSRELKRLNLIIQRFVEYMTPAGENRKKFNIKNLLAVLRANLEPYAQTNQVNLEFLAPDESLQINVNQDEIRTALEHLVTNAIEASTSNQTVTITVSRQAAENVIKITDTGTGISTDEGQKILGLCYTTKQDHVGMGLPLAKKLIEENGGKIRMRTAAKKGTEVFVSFAS